LAVDELTSSDNQQSKKDLNRIAKHQVQRIDKWVRSLMDIMSTDTSLIETLDIKQLLESTIEDVGLNTTNKAKISFDVESKNNTYESNFQLRAIKPELKSLFQSLIANSIEAGITDGQPNKIDIRLEQRDNELLITITDQGVGFSQEIKSKLFSPHNTNKTYGAGMGLYLAHRIVSLKYNGDLIICDNPEMKDCKYPGTKIVLTLNNRV